MRETIKFFVIGLPGPQGSKRYVGHGRMIESSAKVKPWREAVAWQAASQVGGQGFEGPVEVSIDFYLPRPKSAPKSRVWPDRKPDVDKLIRSTFDALVTAGVIADDARVQSVSAQKIYALPGRPTGADIRISDLSSGVHPLDGTP